MRERVSVASSNLPVQSTCTGDQQATQSSSTAMIPWALKAQEAPDAQGKRCTCTVFDHRGERLELALSVRAHLRQTSRPGILKDLGRPRWARRPAIPIDFPRSFFTLVLLPRSGDLYASPFSNSEFH